MPFEANVIRLNVEPPEQRTASARLPIALASVRNEIAGHLRQVLQPLFERADDWLFEIADHTADPGEQHALFEAMRDLRINRPMIERSFQQRVFAAFASIEPDDPQAAGLRRLAATQPLRASQPRDARETAALDAMAARLAHLAAATLSQLTLRIGALTGRKLIEGRNPFGADALCGYFLDACQCLGVEIRVRLLLLKLFERYVIADLDRLYRQSNRTLAAAGVLPGLQVTGEHEVDISQPLLAVSSAPGATHSTSDPCHAEAWPKRLSATDAVIQVTTLFDYLDSDRNLPPSLRTLLHRLLPAFTQLARLDPSLFDLHSHPARQLLDEIAVAAIGWNEHEDLQADPGYRVIEQITRRLATNPIEDSTLFCESLACLRVVCTEERRRSELLTHRTLAAEAEQHRAAQACQRVEAALNARLLGRLLPETVISLLREGWSQVLLHACLQHGARSPNWRAALQTMDQLLWSVTLEHSPQTQRQLLDALPDLLDQLRQGLASVAFDPFATAAFFAGLEAIHLQAAGPATLARAPSVTRRLVVGRFRMGLPVEPEPANAFRDEAPEPVPALMNRLRRGCWMEFNEGETHRLRCKLAALNEPDGVYLFVNRNGLKVLEKTRKGLAADFVRGAVRLLDDSPLFERASVSNADGRADSCPGTPT